MEETLGMILHHQKKTTWPPRLPCSLHPKEFADLPLTTLWQPASYEHGDTRQLHGKVGPALAQEAAKHLQQTGPFAEGILFHLLCFAGCFLRNFMLVLQLLELFAQHGLTHNKPQSSPKHPNTTSPKDRDNGSLGGARLNAVTTFLSAWLHLLTTVP